MKPAAALAHLRALCGLGLHAEVLVPAVLEALHAVVPSSRNLFDWTDAQGRLLRYFIEGPVDAALAQLYFDEFHNRREAEAMPRFDTLPQVPAGVRPAAELDNAAFYRSALYHEIWRPQGFHTRLEGVLRDRAGALLGSLVLYRGPGDTPFSTTDEARLAPVLPALAAALQAAGDGAGSSQAPQAPQVPSPDPPQTLLLTLDGTVCHASAGARGLLLLADGGASRDSLSRPIDALAGGLLPLLLMRLRERELGSLGSSSSSGAPPVSPVSISHETPAGQFVATGTVLRPLDTAAAAPLVQVSLRRLEPHRVALARALRALPVTPGQAAVCRELYHGHSQHAISRRLGVSPATVVDHVRKAYRALGLGSVLELRAALDARIG